MKTRDEEILEQLTELCKVNEYAHFDISIPVLTDEISGFLCFESKSYSLEELQLTLHDIEWLERHEKISIVRKFRFKELSQDEIARTSYSLFVPSKTEIFYGSQSTGKWEPSTIIALFGGVIVCAIAILMFAQNASIVGYDTFYGGGYGYHTLTPPMMLFLGLIILFFGIFTIPKRKKK